jgi:hypothetical protein
MPAGTCRHLQDREGQKKTDITVIVGMPELWRNAIAVGTPAGTFDLQRGQEGSGVRGHPNLHN